MSPPNTRRFSPASSCRLLLFDTPLFTHPGLRTWFERTRDRGKKSFSDRSLFDWCAAFLPCLTWLRTYKIKEFFIVSPVGRTAAGGG